MRYDLVIRPQAVRDFSKLSPQIARRILAKLERMRDDLTGDVKRLANFIPGYRLRVADYRVLFALEGDCILVYRVLHRREAYD